MLKSPLLMIHQTLMIRAGEREENENLKRERGLPPKFGMMMKAG